MNTILAAIDFSPVSRNVVSCAMALARAAHGRLVLFNAVKPPEIATDLPPLVEEVVEFTAQVEQASRRHLKRIQRRCTAEGIDVEVICIQGFPIASILGQAKALEARYIVLGSHGHTAFHDLFLGGAASGVLKRAACPVVIVPALESRTKRRQKRRKLGRREA